MFFAKLAASLALVAPLVSALSIVQPSGWTSAGDVTIDWTAVQDDPQTFSIELTNDAFNRQFALSNNVPTGALTINLTLPIVPAGDGYTLQFVDISNLTNVFAESAPFSIAELVSSSTSSTSSGSASASASSASLTSATTTSAGTTRSAATSATGGTGTTSADVGSSTSFDNDNAAVALGPSGSKLAGYAVMVAAAIAGARFVGF